MKPFTRSIIELFDGKKRYLIPLYQRQYAWRASPQLELLWDDITHAVDRIATDRSSLVPHFMGAIVISQIKTFGKQVQAFEVIDGQQRLTTFQLLLAALRDVAAANGSRYESELQKYLLNDGVMEQQEIERFKLWPSRADRRALVEVIDPEADLGSVAGVPADLDDLVRLSTLAHAYFKARIEDHVFAGGNFEEERFEILFEALKEGLAVVSIELEKGDDAQTIFETLNSRGVDLTPADLMRNFIFQRAKGLGQADSNLVVDKLYERHWLPLDNPFWNQPISRGRQTRPRLDWMLVDHLSMFQGDLVSIETLFENYRRWVLTESPFSSVAEELEAITASRAAARRIFEQSKGDVLGNFGRFADAFDVSTAMPLVLYLATLPESEQVLKRSLDALQSFILRRDICGLPSKNYNKFFVGIIDRLRTAQDDKADTLVRYLSDRTSDLDRWPSESEFRNGWLGRDQYKGSRQPRLRYLFEGIERAMRSGLNEDIEINSVLTVEHIMPQQWRKTWPISGVERTPDTEVDFELLAEEMERDSSINKLGNLTLLTGSLNASVSNGPYEMKMPAVRAHSSLALNRELNSFEAWNETTIIERGVRLFERACDVWRSPDREDNPERKTTFAEMMARQKTGLPKDHTVCRFSFSGRTYQGRIANGTLTLEGGLGSFASFSAASKSLTSTSRNGWLDWELQLDDGSWWLADDWRRAGLH